VLWASMRTFSALGNVKMAPGIRPWVKMALLADAGLDWSGVLKRQTAFVKHQLHIYHVYRGSGCVRNR